MCALFEVGFLPIFAKMTNNGIRIRGIDNVEQVLQMLDDLSDGEVDLDDGDDEVDSDLDGDLDIVDDVGPSEDGQDSDGGNNSNDENQNVSDSETEIESQTESDDSDVVRNTARPNERGRGAGRARGRHRAAARGLGRGRGGRARGRGRGRVRDRSRSPVVVRGANDFVWLQQINDRNFRQFAERIGPQRRYGDDTSEAILFEEYFTPEVWQLLVDMTNLNAETKRRTTPNKNKGKWVNVTVAEMKVFIGLVISMGIIKLPSLRLYWKKSRWFFDIPSFNKVMPRDRFDQIWRYLHFCDERQAPQEDAPNRDKLYKVRPLLDILLPRFESVYVPEKVISIDESMIPFKGRIGFRQFIANKRTRFGIKVWVLAESSTGYIPRLQIYTGRDAEGVPEVGLGARVVNDLMQPYQNKGYHLYLDNFYTSPALFQSLYDREIYACGTLRAGRRGFPADIRIDNPRQHDRGYSKWAMSGPILGQSWLDTKPVYFLSTIHQPEHNPDTPAEERVVKRRGGQRGIDVPCPPLLRDYNIGMGGVDFNDRQRKFYNLGRRSYRWYRRIFFYLLEVAAHNTYVLRRKAVPKKHTDEDNGPLAFRMDLVTQLIGEARAEKNVGRPRMTDAPRLSNVGMHTPIILEKSLVCKVCSKVVSENYRRQYQDTPKDRRPRVPYVSRSQIGCEECDVPLCLTKDRNCFKDWHSKVEYWR